MIERITADEKVRYIAAAVELGGPRKVECWFVRMPSYI
ncbi:hypothetical protein MASSI9I_70409 [Massilia sp. 9I]|nr:hypothetical protein MASSI9I_70409 [Massilia sp. 9I]